MTANTEGHYYKKQLECSCGIIAWSHRSRFEIGLRLIGSNPQKLLDYGCGDGTFLKMAAGRTREGWGADLAVDQVKDCQLRLSAIQNLRFCSIAELQHSSHAGAYDVVTCMETLEHCTTPVVEKVLVDLARLVSVGGKVIISVPIEIGPTFVAKSVIRGIASLRGLGEYRFYERYSLRDAMRMIFAGRNTLVDRPYYGEGETQWHSHYGFNWRAMRERVRSYFSVERTLFSPLGVSGGWLSSQAWFICRPKVD